MSVGYWRTIAIVTLLQLASGTVQAAEKTYTANDLLQDCKDTLIERATFRRPFYSGLCIGLVAGAVLGQIRARNMQDFQDEYRGN